MFLFAEMNSNLTSGLLGRLSRLVVAQSDLEFIGSRTNILNLTLIASH